MVTDGIDEVSTHKRVHFEELSDIELAMIISRLYNTCI